MSKRFFAVAFAIGLVTVAWVGIGFAGTSWMALAMTAAIGGVYLLGAFELRQFRAAGAALSAALADIPQPLSSLGDWLERVPPTLRNAVRLRIEGERGGLPGPALTPYLVGLLVMLGMLGTFLGMVVTFKGAVFALQGSADLQAMRSALAEPIKGLGLAFGTSVAGVAASAMLGLMSAISRRERLDVGRQLDGRIATVLRPFSLAHQRHETFRALQAQATALPEVFGKLEALMERIDRRSQQLDEQLLGRQAQFHGDVRLAYTGLAQAVGASLQDSLAAGALAAGESIRPVVESAMAQIVREAQRLHERVGDAATTQVNAFTDAFEQRSTGLLATVRDDLARSQSDQALAEQQRLQTWTQALQATAAELRVQWQRVGDQAIAQQQDAAQLLARSEELVRSRMATEGQFLEQHGQRMDGLASQWRTQLEALRQEETLRGQAAVDRLGELQAAVAQHLATLGAALEAPITRLLHTASEVPQAAAGVLAQLRQEMSAVAGRDNLALQERTDLLRQFGALLHVVNQASGEQRAAIEALVSSAASVLDQAGRQFAQALAAQAGKAADVATHVSASAIELASLGEGFSQGVQLFQASNDKLMETLQRIEASLNQSTARSDEQLAYYVAQAREVIDLSIASQQGLVDNLRQLQGKPAALADGARG
ncbi:MAG: hypothetical protein JWQ13_368 [Ramlibacter sp.]|nr:hypothetical protein [Ramlibacter sp.]